MKFGQRYAHEAAIGVRCTVCAFNLHQHELIRGLVRCINRRCRERGKWRDVKTLAIAMRQA